MWSDQEKKNIYASVFPYFDSQKFVEKKDIKNILRAWQELLSEDYNDAQIIQAFREYVKRKPDFPAPSDLLQILEPQRQEVSEGAYIAASKLVERLETQWAGSYWPSIKPESYERALQIKKRYEGSQESFTPIENRSKKVLAKTESLEVWENPRANSEGQKYTQDLVDDLRGEKPDANPAQGLINNLAGVKKVLKNT